MLLAFVGGTACDGSDTVSATAGRSSVTERVTTPLASVESEGHTVEDAEGDATGVGANVDAISDRRLDILAADLRLADTLDVLIEVAELQAQFPLPTRSMEYELVFVRDDVRYGVSVVRSTDGFADCLVAAERRTGQPLGVAMSIPGCPVIASNTLSFTVSLPLLNGLAREASQQEFVGGTRVDRVEVAARRSLTDSDVLLIDSAIRDRPLTL